MYLEMNKEWLLGIWLVQPMVRVALEIRKAVGEASSRRRLGVQDVY